MLPTNAATPFKGLQLGSMIGKGGYGRVYCGMYEGQLVAVKVPGTLVGQRWVGRFRSGGGPVGEVQLTAYGSGATETGLVSSQGACAEADCMYALLVITY